jgi:predicted molibdopterin-dependent oxidoreductase YjgC
MTISKTTRQLFKAEGPECGCSTSSTKGIGHVFIPKEGELNIDGKRIKFTSLDHNIVDVASRANITIPAPCYRSDRRQGCCGACVVEINGEQKYACNAIPENQMTIVVNRANLKQIRKQKLKEYKDGIKSGNTCECPPSGSTSCCG